MGANLKLGSAAFGRRFLFGRTQSFSEVLGKAILLAPQSYT